MKEKLTIFFIPLLALIKKELKEYFSSPLIYTISALFIGLLGLMFYMSIIYSGKSEQIPINQTIINPFFGNINFIFLLLAPLLTMKTFAGEKTNNTLNLLIRSNLSSTQIVLGKFLALFMVALFILSLTLIFPIILYLSNYNQLLLLINCYFGSILNICFFLISGILFSALFNNVILAALGAYIFLLFIFILSQVQMLAENFLVGEIISYFSLVTHSESFIRGAVESTAICYYLSFFFFLFVLNIKVLESRDW